MLVNLIKHLVEEQLLPLDKTQIQRVAGELYFYLLEDPLAPEKDKSFAELLICPCLPQEEQIYLKMLVKQENQPTYKLSVQLKILEENEFLDEMLEADKKAKQPGYKRIM